MPKTTAAPAIAAATTESAGPALSADGRDYGSPAAAGLTVRCGGAGAFNCVDDVQ